MENIIFGIMVVIVVSAGMLTCIYEIGGSSHASEQSNIEQDNTKNQ